MNYISYVVDYGIINHITYVVENTPNERKKQNENNHIIKPKRWRG